MANTLNEIAMHVFARPGHLVVCEEHAHTGEHEAAAAALLSGVAFRRLRSKHRGLLSADQVAVALSPDNPFDTNVVDLVTIENTHHVGGGTPMPIGDARAIARVCAERGVPLYLDGARIFNACAVTGATVMDYTSQADA